MSYTLPAGNAADFTWSGTAAYTAPTGSSADFSFADTTPTASGFSSTAFGVAVADSVAPVIAAQGFLSSAFGTPSCAAAFVGAASAALSASVGAPQALATMTALATSVAVGSIGVPTFVNGRATSLGPVTQIPQAYFRFAQWEESAPVRTPDETNFGLAWYTPPLPPLNADGWARGFKATTAGSHSCLVPVSVQETGWIEELFGSPVSGQSYAASGLTSTTLGTPVSSGLARAEGFNTTHFGAASNVRAQAASALYRPTRWGAPRSEILGTCKARGFYTVRWTQPVARTGNFRFAAGLDASARFGTPSPRNTFRAQHIAPVVRYGRNLLRRNTTC